MAKEQILIVDQGSKFSYTIEVRFDGVKVDLSGWTARMQIRGDRRLDSPVIATFTTSPGGRLTIAGPESQVLVDILGADSVDWEWDRGQYDITVYEPAGEPHRILQGEIRVNHIVTASA